MKTIFLSVSCVVISAMLAGCNTLTHTAKGSAEGFKKDVQFVQTAAKKADPVGNVMRADAWMQEHMW